MKDKTKNKPKTKSKKKAFLAVAIFGLAALSGGGPALAEFTTLNSLTGFNSINNSTSFGQNLFVLDNINSETVSNVSLGSGNTGFNLSDMNNGGASILSGNLVAQGGFDNEFNVNGSNAPITGPVWLGNFGAGNFTTGAFSTNDAMTQIVNDFSALNSNYADAYNNAYVDANTGYNLADMNSGRTWIETGNAGLTLIEANSGNVNGLILPFGGIVNPLFSSIAENNTTGALSTNYANVDVLNNLGVVNTNTANIVNDAFVDANTGNNVASSNSAGCGIGCSGLGGVGIRTGSAIANVAIANQPNSSFTTLNLGGGLGLVRAVNANTGALSSNVADVYLNNNVSVVNYNDAYIDNDVNTHLNTGNNVASFNSGSCGLNPCGGIGGTTIGTGNALSNVQIQNTNVNENVTNLNLGFGAGNVQVGNSTTGALSNNTATAQIDNTATVVNSNDAYIDNNVYTDSNTGNNIATSNNGGGAIFTGNAASNVAIANEVNSNATNLNITPGVLNAQVGNSNTGALSTNDASLNVDNSVSVTNTNTADIDNNVNVSSNTGNNASSMNTGGGSVMTGNSTVSFGVVNQANSNSF